ncbi:MAG: GTP pyrophosphokinase family protein [Clostridia bacterium]|nr:GTP pyrophosphokinase family protein [Clostridia bacterium]
MYIETENIVERRNVNLDYIDANLLELNKTLTVKNELNINDEVFKNLMFIHSMAIKELTTKLEIIEEEFKVLYNYELINQITSRVKAPDSILKKMKNKDIELTYKNLIDNINDIAGVRIICTTKDDIFMIRDLISNLVNVKILKEKDYVTYPKKSGYSSYHILCEVPVNVGREIVNIKIEIQIRTKVMDLWASIEHDIKYKSNNKLTKKMSDELVVCAKKLDKIESKMSKIYLNAIN